MPNTLSNRITMPTYRLYIYDRDRHLIAPAMLIPAAGDDAAITEAASRVNGVYAELMEGERLVKVFQAND